MKRLSSRLTIFWKLFPVLWLPWFGSVVIYEWWRVVSAAVLFGYLLLETRLVGVTILLLFLSGFLLWLCAPLKSVFHYGDGIEVRGLKSSEHINFDQIDSVTGPDWSTLRRITLDYTTQDLRDGTVIFTPPIFQARQVANMLRAKTARPPK